MPICNICGNSEFFCPKYRQSGKSLSVLQGKPNFPPACTKCGSMERHRIIYEVYQQHKNLSKKPLLLSNDPARFYLPSNLEISIFNERNSINLECIDREDNSYDLIFCHHILEHLKNDKTGFSELCRILMPGGQLYWSVPSPTTLEKTVNVNPDSNPHKHYRWYGKDFLITVSNWDKNNKVTTQIIKAIDKVTCYEDIVFLTTKTID